MRRRAKYKGVKCGRRVEEELERVSVGSKRSCLKLCSSFSGNLFEGGGVAYVVRSSGVCDGGGEWE